MAKSHRIPPDTPYSQKRIREARPEKPYYGSGTGVCCHPFCSAQIWDRHPLLLLCQSHALNVWDAIDADAWLHQQIQERRARQRPEPAAPRVGQLYYLQIGPDIKIGYASSLWQRMQSYPPTATLLAVQPGTTDDEKALHAQFAASRIAGREWYRASPELLAHIEQVKAEHGEPIDLFSRRLHSPPGSDRPVVRMRRRSAPQGWAV